MSDECVERERLETKLKIAKADARLWKKRTEEATNTVEQYEQLEAENKKLKKAIESFGKNLAGFDWAVLERIDTLEHAIEHTLDCEGIFPMMCKDCIWLLEKALEGDKK